jgi:hypothetical protein
MNPGTPIGGVLQGADAYNTPPMGVPGFMTGTMTVT